MNATITRFGYPATLVAGYAHWVVLLRPAQPTLGSLVLAAKSGVTAFPELPPDAFAELAVVTADLEAAVRATVDPVKINYLMLMMVDPHVHFHVIPRYEGERSAEGVSVADAGWPSVPALGAARALSAAEIGSLAAWLKARWASARG